MNRRQVLQKSLLALGGLAIAGKTHSRPRTIFGDYPIKHSVAKWCFPDITLEDLCEISLDLGIKSIELAD